MSRHGSSGATRRPLYPLENPVFVDDEVYAYGLWFPSIREYNEFLVLVERAHRRKEGQRPA